MSIAISRVLIHREYARLPKGKRRLSETHLQNFLLLLLPLELKFPWQPVRIHEHQLLTLLGQFQLRTEGLACAHTSPPQTQTQTHLHLHLALIQSRYIVVQLVNLDQQTVPVQVVRRGDLCKLSVCLLGMG